MWLEGALLVLGATASPPTWEGCKELNREEVFRLLKIEQRAERSSGAGLSQCQTLRVSCTPQAWTLEVEAAGFATQVRRMEVTTLPTGTKERFIALALAELCFVATTPPPEKPIVEAPPPPPPPPPPEVPPEPSPWSLAGGARARTFFTGGLKSVGAELSLARRWHQVWFAKLRVAGETGGATTSLGSVAFRAGSASLAWARLIPLPWGGLTLEGGAQGGFARLQGRPSSTSTVEGQTVQGPWGGPYLRASYDLPLRGGLSLTAGVESGATLLPLRGQVEGEKEVGVRGLWGGLSLGLSWSAGL